MYEYSDQRYFASLNNRSRLVDRIFGNVPGHFCGVRFSGVLEQDMIPCLVLVHPRKTCHSMTEKNADWDVKNQNTEEKKIFIKNLH